MGASPTLGDLTPPPRLGTEEEVTMSASETETETRSTGELTLIDLYSTRDTMLDSMVSAHGESGIWGGIFNYTNFILGSGIVGMPYAIYNCGLWLGLILLVVIGSFSAISSHWVVKMGLKRNQHNYDDLCRNVLGPAWGYLHSATSMILAFTASITYMMIMGSSLEDIAEGLDATGFIADRRFYILICGVAIMLPLSCFRNMDHLRFVSFISIGVEVGIVLLILFYSTSYSLQEDNDIVPFRDARSERLTYFIGPDAFLGLPTFLFAFIGQHGSIEIFRSLKEPSYSNWQAVANFSILIAGVLSVLMCSSSWLNLGDSIQPNIMDTFGPHDIPSLIGKFFLAITMIMTFPLCLFVCRRNLNQAVYVNLLGMEDYMPFWRHALTTLGIWATCLAISLLFSDLTAMFGFGGAVGASFVGFITPSLLYLKAFEAEIRAAFQKSKLQGLDWATIPTACLMFGLFGLVAGTVATGSSI